MLNLFCDFTLTLCRGFLIWMTGRFWKKQLKIAMDSTHADIMCYRVFLNYRLLKGTSRFFELQKFIEDMKAALENELGPISEAAVKFSHAHTGRLNSSVQALCKLAIQKAEELQTSNSSSLLNLSGMYVHNISLAYLHNEN